MTLLIEVVGSVALAGVVRALIPGAGVSLASAIAMVAVAIGGSALWLDGYQSVRNLLDQHEAYEGLTVGQANAAAGGLFPADEGFLAWVETRVPKGARVYLECAGHCPGEWVTFRLAPRVFVSSPSAAQFALFYDVAPSSASYAHGKPLAVFAPADTSNDGDFVARQEAVVTLHP